MKSMIRMALAGWVLLFGNAVIAQGHQRGHGMERHAEIDTLSAEEIAGKRTEKMKQELTLTETQEAEIYRINLAHVTEMKRLREEQKVLREKMKAEKENARQKIKAVLTPEQNAIFDQNLEEHKQKQEEHRKNGHD